MKKPWRLLAEMLKTTSIAFGESKWHRLEIGPHRRVRCSCGGMVIDSPPTTYEGGGCTHIVALYTGAIIEDAAAYKERERRREGQSIWAKNALKPLTRFTELGKNKFHAMYTVSALKQ